jgi:nicotinate-nucleotide pyrophosphorylase (carboxylating)
MTIPPSSEYINQFIANALQEDVGPGDHTTLAIVPPEATGTAVCRIKDTGVLAGVAFARQVFNFLDTGVRFTEHLPDGTAVQPGDIAFEVHGSLRALLTGERLALNVLQRMSGIATHTRRVVQELHGTRTQLLDTRKTTPLFRAFEKWAVQIGGGQNHRFGLYDLVMIKDNHHDFAGGICAALRRVREYLAANQLDLRIEVETRNLSEVRTVLECGGADIIMLDNMDLETMRKAVELIAGRALTEASGGITLENIRAVANTRVDYISMGALTHHVKSLDISLKAVVAS